MQPYVPPRDPTEVLGRRSAAFLIDFVFLAVVGAILFATATHHSFYDAPANACSQITRSGSSICVQVSDRLYVWDRDAYTRATLLAILAGFLDLVVLQTVTGASIGKLCVGLRVVEAQGNEARFMRVLGRWLFLAIDLGCFIVGLVTTLVTHPHRRVGDLVCGTYVVGVANVGHPVVVLPVPLAYGGAAPTAYGAMPGAPVPPGWGTPAAVTAVPPPAPVATPPGTSPTTPGEWGAVARSAPVVRAPKWEAPPPVDVPPAPVARDTMAPQWATPPGPKQPDAPDAEPHAAAEPMPAPRAAPEPLAAVPQWSPIVPLTTNDESPATAEVVAPPEARTAEPATEVIQPPPPPPTPWKPIVPATGADPTPPPGPVPEPPAPAPPAPAEPVPPPPTEPPPAPPAAVAKPKAKPRAKARPKPKPAPRRKPAPPAAAPEPKVVAPPPVVTPEADDDVPWWDAEPSHNDADG